MRSAGLLGTELIRFPSGARLVPPTAEGLGSGRRDEAGQGGVDDGQLDVGVLDGAVSGCGRTRMSPAGRGGR